MLLKVIADGLCGYIRVGFNVFDGFIVILRHVSRVRISNLIISSLFESDHKIHRKYYKE